MITAHPRHRCEHCGYRADNHLPSTGRCPATEKFPKWPKYAKGNEERKGEIFDERIAKYWGKRSTVFLPMV